MQSALPSQRQAAVRCLMVEAALHWHLTDLRREDSSALLGDEHQRSESQRALRLNFSANWPSFVFSLFAAFSASRAALRWVAIFF